MDELQSVSEGFKPNRLEPPQKTFFFQRHDGSVICVGEQEAWAILNHRQKVIGKFIPPAVLIGVGDGTKFATAVAESHQMFRDGKTKEEITNRLRQGEAEELAAAKGKIEMPRNFDSIDQNRNPVNIRAL